jgi:hypothetical protein
MSDDALGLYRRFLAGEPGTCIFAKQNGCHAFATEDEVEATYGSRHDGSHFVWLGPLPRDLGFVSDDHIDALLAKRSIAFSYSEMNGRLGADRESLKAAFLLGAARMSRVLGLPVDADKRVSPGAIKTLPLVLRTKIESLDLPSPAPLASLVEMAIPLGSIIEDAEGRGRLAVLTRAAVGADLSDIEVEAKRCAAWIADRVAREKRADQITHQMLDQLAGETITTYDDFLDTKVEISRSSMQAGRGRSNEEVELDFAARRSDAIKSK